MNSTRLYYGLVLANSSAVSEVDREWYGKEQRLGLQAGFGGQVSAIRLSLATAFESV
jgi:hypothetical protein